MELCERYWFRRLQVEREEDLEQQAKQHLALAIEFESKLKDKGWGCGMKCYGCTPTSCEDK